MKKWIYFFTKKYSSQRFSSSLASLVLDQNSTQKPTASVLKYMESYRQALMKYCITEHKYSSKQQNALQETLPPHANTFADSKKNNRKNYDILPLVYPMTTSVLMQASNKFNCLENYAKRDAFDCFMQEQLHQLQNFSAICIETHSFSTQTGNEELALSDEVAPIVSKLLCAQQNAVAKFCIIDEKIAIAVGALPAPDAEKLAQKIVKTIQNNYYTNTANSSVICAAGIDHASIYNKNAQTLLQNAIALAQESTMEKMTHLHFAITEPKKLSELIKNDLKESLEKNQLQVWYQPKLCAKTRKIKGAEALIRWFHPEQGFIPPLNFIAIAKQEKIIEKLSFFVIEQVFMHALLWRKQKISPGKIAINLSCLQILTPNFITRITALLQKYSVNPRQFTLEIAESEIRQDDHSVMQILTKLKYLGFSLSIDDFGSGSSSLCYLMNHPIDELKLDRSFTKKLDKDSQKHELLKNIIQLSQTLKLNVVAEGVDSQQQALLLQETGCNELQGYLFYQPMPHQKFERLFMA
ncbi:MAG: EAL domain-containing protein [Enterovibrio sp.]